MNVNKIRDAVRQLISKPDNPKPTRTIIMTPVMDARVDVLYVNSLIPTLQSGFADAHMFLSCDSNIAHARNTMANMFLGLPGFDQLVMIDADIQWRAEDWSYLMEGPEPIVVCEYARKSHDGTVLPPVKFGAGFARVHRLVLEALQNLRTPEGAERLPRYFESGQMLTDFFYTGATNDGRYLSEDRGFWAYCQLADLPVRAETRTRLVHIGRALFPYKPVDPVPAG